MNDRELSVFVRLELAKIILKIVQLKERSTHTPTQVRASTSRMRAAISRCSGATDRRFALIGTHQRGKAVG